MTKLTVQDLTALALDLGAEITEQKSFIKITSPAKNRKALYIGKTKRVFTRVDVAGFEPEDLTSVKRMSAEKAKSLSLGAVRGQILSKELAEEISDDRIAEDFQTLVSSMMDESEGFKAGPKKEETTEEN